MSQGIELLIDGSHGVHVAQRFAQKCGGLLGEGNGHWHGFTADDLNILLAGFEHEKHGEHYFETWDKVLREAYFLDKDDGKKWNLQQYGDLFAFCLDKMTLSEKHAWDIDVSDELNEIMDRNPGFDVDYSSEVHGYIWFGKGENATLKSKEVFGTADAAMMDCISENHLE